MTLELRSPGDPSQTRRLLLQAPAALGLALAGFSGDAVAAPKDCASGSIIR